MNGGGGDGGYQERADSDALKKQRARDQLNALFGASVSGAGAAPDAGQFQREEMVTFDGGGDSSRTETRRTFSLDEPRYTQAMQDYAQAKDLQSQSEKNRMARESLYGTVRQNAFNSGKRFLDEANDDAKKKTKFSLFDRGLNGSSLADDQYNLLDRTYRQGVLNLGAQADATKADLMGSDESTRLGLLQSLDGGMDQGSAISSALNQMKVSSDRAGATQIGSNIGDLFAGSGALYAQNRMNNEKERARLDFRNAYPELSSGRGNGVITKA